MKSTIPHQKAKKQLLWRRLALIVIIAIVILAVSGFILFKVLVARQDVSLLEEPLPAATIFYDGNKEEALRISPKKAEAVSYDNLPENVINAVVAVEDKRFFEHSGMDLQGIGRAVLINLTNGKTVQGASTITQQLAKNVFLSQERTWSRKWKELLLAEKIEKNYTKQQILTFYLNGIYFGEGAWGIKKASETYFGIPVDELNLTQSALLAGIIKAPSALSPYSHPDKAIARRNVVLKLMKEQGKIDAAAYEASIQEPLHIQSTKPGSDNAIKYPYFIDQIIREAGQKYGLTENEMLHGGYRIYTTLDIRMQEAAEKVYSEDSLFPASSSDQLIQSGAVLVDPRDGGIRALIGGRGEQPFRGFNRAVQLKRQPGSTLKPIAVYTPALENGYTPESVFQDEPVQFGDYQPTNAGGGYHGSVTLYEALIHSYNVPAVSLLNEMGIDAGMDAAKRFGITLTDADRTLGLALGGLQEGVSPLEMAEAFGVFANDGTRIPAHSIMRIETPEGEIIAEAESESGASVKVTEPSIARTMTAMLEDVVKEGTGTAASLGDRPMAGKTGTTDMPGTSGQGIKDNWFVGYTPQLVGAVWLGYDHTDAAHYLTTTSKAAAVVFQKLMSEALEGEPVMTFPVAQGKPGKAEPPGKTKEEKEKKKKPKDAHPGKDRAEKEDKKKKPGDERKGKEKKKRERN